MKKLIEHWLSYFHSEDHLEGWWYRKKELNKKRMASIVQINGNGHLYQRLRYDDQISYRYDLHFRFLIKQQKLFYIEERIIPFQFRMINDTIVDHKVMPRESTQKQRSSRRQSLDTDGDKQQRFSYDRRAAVKYAEHWWNRYNPDFQTFTVDCTNYVSQCLLAGGAPMRGEPVRDRGWWYQNDNWSFSWAVAHSLRWYLSGSESGLKGREVESATELYPGDIICYDFQGDGRWDHNTIVVAKDAEGMPLVNAHTDNSRHRYWSYEDSTAWTPHINYKFFRIGE